MIVCWFIRLFSCFDYTNDELTILWQSYRFNADHLVVERHLKINSRCFLTFGAGWSWIKLIKILYLDFETMVGYNNRPIWMHYPNPLVDIAIYLTIHLSIINLSILHGLVVFNVHLHLFFLYALIMVTFLTVWKSRWYEHLRHGRHAASETFLEG